MYNYCKGFLNNQNLAKSINCIHVPHNAKYYLLFPSYRKYATQISVLCQYLFETGLKIQTNLKVQDLHVFFQSELMH